jgi:hypothetical protein
MEGKGIKWRCGFGEMGEEEVSEYRRGFGRVVYFFGKVFEGRRGLKVEGLKVEG